MVAGLGFEPRQAESEVCLNAIFIGLFDHCTPFTPEMYPKTRRESGNLGVVMISSSELSLSLNADEHRF